MSNWLKIATFSTASSIRLSQAILSKKKMKTLHRIKLSSLGMLGSPYTRFRNFWKYNWGRQLISISIGPYLVMIVLKGHLLTFKSIKWRWLSISHHLCNLKICFLEVPSLELIIFLGQSRLFIK